MKYYQLFNHLYTTTIATDKLVECLLLACKQSQRDDFAVVIQGEIIEEGQFSNLCWMPGLLVVSSFF